MEILSTKVSGVFEKKEEEDSSAADAASE